MSGDKDTSDKDTSDKEHGEGNYKASREYNDATRAFSKSGKVEEAVRNAEPKNAAEEREMEAAEDEGRSHAKGEDPALNRRAK